MEKFDADSKLIDALGGTKAVASLFEITDSAVSQWRHAGIPKVNRMYLKLIRPDVFGKKKAKRK